MSELLLDASAFLGWMLPSQGTVAAVALAGRLHTFDLLAPFVFPFEMRGVLLHLEHRDKAPGLAQRGVVYLDALGIAIGEAPDRLTLDAAFAFARRTRTGLFDAMYVLLAVEAGAQLATRDIGMLDAAKALSVSTLDLR